MSKYQNNYAAGRPQMYDEKSRRQKADRVVKLLREHLKGKKLNKLSLLDIGSSTGIISYELSKSFGQVTAIDIDQTAIKYAKSKFKRKNLKFILDNAMNLNIKDDVYDVAICAQVYEHIPDPNKLMSELHRVLKPGGICYFAALNRLWPLEPHYNLFFLSWLPKPLGNLYVKLTGKSDQYYETLKTPWGLAKLCQNFQITRYTSQILKNPKKFGFENQFNTPLKKFFAKTWSPLAKFTAPTLFWILKKESEEFSPPNLKHHSKKLENRGSHTNKSAF